MIYYIDNSSDYATGAYGEFFYADPIKDREELDALKEVIDIEPLSSDLLNEQYLYDIRQLAESSPEDPDEIVEWYKSDPEKALKTIIEDWIGYYRTLDELTEELLGD